MLVGENGAGKSTLMKVIAGVEQLTAGQMLLDGKPVRFASTAEAAKAGIGIVFQELNLFPNLSVADNIFIARSIRGAGSTSTGSGAGGGAGADAAARARHPAGDAGGELRIGQQQIVEIAKALAQDARILILDEPTSALSAAEVEILFRVIADLKRRGVGIVYISHRLEELIRIGDWITVLRDGRITGSREMAGVDVGWIVRNMIGAASKDYARTGDHALGAEVFRAEEITLPRPAGGRWTRSRCRSGRARSSGSTG